MRNAIKSIFNFKFINIILVIELTMALYLLNISSITTEEAIIKSNNLKRFFNFNSTYLINCDIFLNENSDPVDNFPKISLVYDELDKLKKEGLIKDVYFFYGGGINPVAENKDFIPNKYKNIYSSTHYTPLGMIMLNESFYNQYNINISEGRGFTEKDFNVKGLDENIPIILGEDFKEKVKIGDCFPSTAPDFRYYEMVGVNLNFEVIGFYKHNDIPLLGQESQVLSNIQYSDAFGIFPLVTDVLALSYEPMLAQYGAFVDVISPNRLPLVIKRLNNAVKEEGFKINYQSLSEDFKKIDSLLEKEVLNTRLIAIVFIILSLVGVSTIMLGRLNNRRIEFATKIATGATINKLILEIIFENSLICIISTTLSFIFLTINYKNYISTSVIISNLTITFIIILLINIIPILKLKKLKIINLFRSE